MISIELIFPVKAKRHCMRVDEMTTVSDLKKYICSVFNVRPEDIFILTSCEHIDDDMTLLRAGMYTGSGVVIDDG